MPPVAEPVDVGLLFETWHDRVYRYVLGMMKNPAEAHDLTQETFLRAYRHADALRDPQAVLGWLYRIATHACLDRLRQSRPTLSLDEETGTNRARTLASNAPSPLELSERRETSACVQRCLEYLPDPYRVVILLSQAHGLTAREIADLLGVSLATVKIRLHRARRKLQKIMEYGCEVSTDNRGRPVCNPRC